MLNSWRLGDQRNPPVRAAVTVGLAVGVALVLGTGLLRAQLPPLQPAHLNPMIEKLAAGKAVFGPIISDLSMTSARTWARSNADYVWIDMEHNPLNMEAVANFIAFSNDRSYTVKRGDGQPKVAIVARFPPYPSDSAAWIAKQALDMGLMGIVYNTVNTKEEATAIVRQMRYFPQRNDPNTQKGPIGMRGYAPGGALWNWGISAPEYQRRADLWPLNPNGDLLSIFLIETPEGVKNIDEIASVPGVGVINAAAAGDLSNAMGIAGQANTSPEVEAHRQTILKACISHNIVCGILANGKADIDRRLKEGWKMLTTPSGTAAQ
jgi:4-hydroxy-2-oxoheptanedioate aldolase